MEILKINEMLGKYDQTINPFADGKAEFCDPSEYENILDVNFLPYVDGVAGVEIINKSGNIKATHKKFNSTVYYSFGAKSDEENCAIEHTITSNDKGQKLREKLYIRVLRKNNPSIVIDYDIIESTIKNGSGEKRAATDEDINMLIREFYKGICNARKLTVSNVVRPKKSGMGLKLSK